MSISSENKIEYNTWRSVKGRCNNPNHTKYYHYGARGIKMSSEWMNSFEQFLSDMGKRPSDGHSIDRIDTLGNYEASNCRWVTKEEQMRNRGVFNRRYTYKGVEKCMAEWVKECGIPAMEFNRRLVKGWSIEETIETPYVKRLVQRAVIDISTNHIYKNLNQATKALGLNQAMTHLMLNGKKENTTNLRYYDAKGEN